MLVQYCAESVSGFSCTHMLLEMLLMLIEMFHSPSHSSRPSHSKVSVLKYLFVRKVLYGIGGAYFMELRCMLMHNNAKQHESLCS